MAVSLRASRHRVAGDRQALGHRQLTMRPGGGSESGRPQADAEAAASVDLGYAHSYSLPPSNLLGR